MRDLIHRVIPGQLQRNFTLMLQIGEERKKSQSGVSLCRKKTVAWMQLCEVPAKKGT